ncbi:MAG: serine aminopeptidase domain-containing protein [Acidimicrobiales bacterium]
MSRAVGMVGAVGLVAVLLVGCSSGPEASPAGSGLPAGGPGMPAVRRNGSTYVVPTLGAVGRGGDLLAASGPEPAGPDLAGAERYTLLYRSADARNRPVAVSAALLVPSGRPPPGGWPIVSWGHGTTGMADRCAPSARANFGYDEYAQELATLVRTGYAVAASDLPGLGTPGIHAYLVGADEGNAMVDVVVAARHRVPALATTWFAIGHSQGGQAVLFASRAAQRAPGLRLGATIAIAPAAGLDLILPAVISGNDPADVAYAIYALAGLSTVDPTVRLVDLLAPAARAQLPLILDSACLEEADAAFAHEPPADVFRLSAAQITDLSARLDRWGDPDRTAVAGPVLVVQGADDTDVPAGITQRTVDRLQGFGSDVTLRLYPGQGHDSVLGPSICDQLDFLARHGGRPAGACQPYRTAGS